VRHIFEKISYLITMTYVTLQDLRFDLFMRHCFWQWPVQDCKINVFNMCSMISLHSWKNIWDLLAAVHRRLKLQDLHFKDAAVQSHSW